MGMHLNNQERLNDNLLHTLDRRYCPQGPRDAFSIDWRRGPLV